MATITDPAGKPVSEREQIAALVNLGMSREYARFVVALTAGRTSGDVVALDEDGKPTTPPRKTI